MSTPYKWNLPPHTWNEDHDWLDEQGCRHLSGRGGGTLEFYSNGDIRILWMENAALATDYATGHRSSKILEPAKPGMPPELNELFDKIRTLKRCREVINESDDLRTLNTFRGIASRLLKAVANGDSDFLRQVADLTEASQKMKLSVSIQTWETVADALHAAAKKANGVPFRRDVQKHFNDSQPVNRQRDIRNALSRMGFGWLPAPEGKPRKPETKGD